MATPHANTPTDHRARASHPVGLEPTVRLPDNRLFLRLSRQLSPPGTRLLSCTDTTLAQIEDFHRRSHPQLALRSGELQRSSSSDPNALTPVWVVVGLPKDYLRASTAHASPSLILSMHE